MSTKPMKPYPWDKAKTKAEWEDVMGNKMDYFSSLKHRKKITTELNKIINSTKKGVSNPFNYNGRNVGLIFMDPNGGWWEKDDDYLPDDIQNGSLGKYTYEIISQSRALGNDEGTQGSTGMIHHEGDEPVWNIGSAGSVWMDIKHNETRYRVHYVSKHNQNKKIPARLLVEDMEMSNPFDRMTVIKND